MRCSGYFYFYFHSMPLLGLPVCFFSRVSRRRRKLLHGNSAAVLDRALLLALPSSAVFAQACNCRGPSLALLITAVISIIAVCYPRAQTTLGCSELSSPSFLPRTLSSSPALVCRLVGRGATAADRSHHRHSLVATFIILPPIAFCPFLRLAARTQPGLYSRQTETPAAC